MLRTKVISIGIACAWSLHLFAAIPADERAALIQFAEAVDHYQNPFTIGLNLNNSSTNLNTS